MAIVTTYAPAVSNLSNNGFSLLFSKAKYSATIAASTDTSFTVSLGGDGIAYPSVRDGFIAIFKIQQGKNVYCAVNTAASVPAGASFAETDSELLISGDGRFVRNGDVLHFYTTDSGGAEVTVLFYSK